MKKNSLVFQFELFFYLNLLIRSVNMKSPEQYLNNLINKLAPHQEKLKSHRYKIWSLVMITCMFWFHIVFYQILKLLNASPFFFFYVHISFCIKVYNYAYLDSTSYWTQWIASRYSWNFMFLLSGTSCLP